VIFVPEWPKGEFVSLLLAAFCWTKSLLCNVVYLIRDIVIFRVYTSFMCFKKTLCIIQDSEVQIPDSHQSSNIHLDDENCPSGLPSVSRSFELFQIASIQTSQQHIRMPFNVRQVKGFPFQTQIWEDSCKPSRRCGYSVQTLSLIRQDVQKS
jgi:hypothetical protein